MDRSFPRQKFLGSGGPPPIVLAITLVCAALELSFEAAEAGLLPLGDLRWTVFWRFAFFDVIFEAMLDGQSVPLWFWWTPVTYAFLHGGLLHLLMNSILFMGLGGMIVRSIGTGRFAVLFCGTAIGGALGLALLADVQGPLVGASGVVFGLIGALKWWELRFLRAARLGYAKFWRTVAALVLANVLIALVLPGEGTLAWQAHLGGFVAGFLMAPLLAPRFAALSPI